jgi:hypothetical protein
MTVLASRGPEALRNSRSEKEMTSTYVVSGYAVVAALFGLWCGSLWKDAGGEYWVGFAIGFVFEIFGLIYVVLATRGRPSRRPRS